MSICSDISITRQEALEEVFDKLVRQQTDLVRRAVNAMSDSDLASELHSEMYFYHVTGKGKLKAPWERK